ncbi:MAG: lipoyl(octanoyl) transferase LipB [Candidatus Omnitrophica bacterium]|nr:lipoyl(octanoyl) transferase LipB [Candidatus Omnitrophota bacterium]MBU1128681.1 lipoyl(octanoyl) transferase LipB [Candidatus Omnitrophota bacterium]MBU1785163.1 lipoyl(octanoyl) transferase LipB [Candidatus Omnitrophota bacterium]MBU1852189.1 lipoyl(octanoyl) transferase LipB [Candidatus Omnitrophota bacterium]
MDVVDLGLTAYEDALSTQLELLNRRIKGNIPDTLIVTEHLPVVTLGRTAENSAIDRAYFENENIPVVMTNRGGNNTFHSPGQVILYPIMDLRGIKKDVSFYIDFLEETVANSLRVLNVAAKRNSPRRGVWVGEKKIAFFGVAFKRWVTFHGVSVNVNNDIGPFSRMAPCGEADIKVTSVKKITGHMMNMTEIKEIFTRQFIKDLEAVSCRCDCRSFPKMTTKLC